LAGADKQAIEDKQHEIAVFNAARAKQLADQSAKDKEKADKIREEAIKGLRSLTEEIIDIQSEYGILSDAEQIEIANKKILNYLEDQIKKLKEYGKTLSVDVSGDVKKLQDVIDGFKNRKKENILFLPSKKELNESISDLGSFVADKIKKINEDTAKEIGAKMKIVIPEPDTEGFLEGINSFEDLFNSLLDDIFGDDSPKAREFLKGLGSLVSEFGNILNEANELQIEAIDKQLDALSERREKSQDELDKELELQKEGLANNVSGKEKEVESLLSEEKRLTDEREKIQKEAQRRQLVAETIQQTQGLITSAINIYKGFSVLGPFGIPLAIAAIGAMFGFFAKTKAQAFAATKLYTGANRIDDHFGEVGSRSDIPGRGEGYRVVDAVTGQDTNVRISGKEMLLPEDITQSQKRFFKNLKAGKYNFDIADVLDLHSSLKESVNGGVVQQTIINTTQLPSKQWVTYTTKKGVNKAILLEVPKKGEIGSTYIFQD